MDKPINDFSAYPGLYERVAQIIKEESIDGYYYYNEDFEHDGRIYHLYANGGPDMGAIIIVNEKGEYSLDEPIIFKTNHPVIEAPVEPDYWELPGMIPFLQKILDDNYLDGAVYFDDTITFDGLDFRYFLFTDSRDPRSGLLEYIGPHIEKKEEEPDPVPHIIPKSMKKKRT